MSDILIMESLARVEHKIDLVMKHLKITMTAPMHFTGIHMCPACGQSVTYSIDFQHNVVKRGCGCRTGRQPITLDLTPPSAIPKQTQGVSTNDNPDSDGAAGTEHGNRR